MVHSCFTDHIGKIIGVTTKPLMAKVYSINDLIVKDIFCRPIWYWWKTFCTYKKITESDVVFFKRIQMQIYQIRIKHCKKWSKNCDVVQVRQKAEISVNFLFRMKVTFESSDVFICGREYLNLKREFIVCCYVFSKTKHLPPSFRYFCL